MHQTAKFEQLNIHQSKQKGKFSCCKAINNISLMISTKHKWFAVAN